MDYEIVLGLFVFSSFIIIMSTIAILNELYVSPILISLITITGLLTFYIIGEGLDEAWGDEE